MACQVALCTHPGSTLGNPGPPKQSMQTSPLPHQAGPKDIHIFFFWKISPELTSATNSPLFLMRKTDTELTSVPIFLYFICGMPATAWLAKWCHVCTRDLNQQTPGCRSRTCELNCCATGPAPQLPFALSIFLGQPKSVEFPPGKTTVPVGGPPGLTCFDRDSLLIRGGHLGDILKG